MSSLVMMHVDSMELHFEDMPYLCQRSWKEVMFSPVSCVLVSKIIIGSQDLYEQLNFAILAGFEKCFSQPDIHAYPRTNWNWRTCNYLANAEITKQIKHWW